MDWFCFFLVIGVNDFSQDPNTSGDIDIICNMYLNLLD